jgi:uncharacterized protein GlcG (DUF336 family)
VATVGSATSRIARTAVRAKVSVARMDGASVPLARSAAACARSAASVRSRSARKR